MENINQVQQDNNLSIYESVRSVPSEAKKVIEAGRLKGKSDINLFVKKDGEWRKAIYGNGGNKFISHERKYENGTHVLVPYHDDDAYKKAYTDAISVVAKALEVGTDVYFEKTVTKYDSPVQSTQSQSAVVPTLPALTSKSPSWKSAVTFTTSLKNDAEFISKKIRLKYTISDEDRKCDEYYV